MKTIHKRTTTFNGYTWTLCGKAFASRSRYSINNNLSSWKHVNCLACLSKKKQIQTRLLKAIKNYENF